LEGLALLLSTWGSPGSDLDLAAGYSWDFLVGFLTPTSVVYSVVGIVTGYGQDNQGVTVRVPVESRIFSSPWPSDRFWCPPNLLSNGYGGLFPQG
jgi:hypothetical protein